MLRMSRRHGQGRRCSSQAGQQQKDPGWPDCTPSSPLCPHSRQDAQISVRAAPTGPTCSFICCPCPLPELPEGTARSCCFEGLPGNSGASPLRCSSSPGDTRGQKSPLMTAHETASYGTAVMPPLLSPISTQWEFLPHLPFSFGNRPVSLTGWSKSWQISIFFPRGRLGLLQAYVFISLVTS